MLSLLSNGAIARRNHVIAAFRARGALSPATARPLEELHVAADDSWHRLVVEGLVREGPPGHFYLFERPRPSTRQRIVKMVVFYALIVLIPIVLMLASRNGH